MRANLAIVKDQASAARAFLAAESERLRLQIQQFTELAEKAREMALLIDEAGGEWKLTINKQGALKSEKVSDAPPTKR